MFYPGLAAKYDQEVRRKSYTLLFCDKICSPRRSLRTRSKSPHKLAQCRTHFRCWYYAAGYRHGSAQGDQNEARLPSLQKIWDPGWSILRGRSLKFVAGNLGRKCHYLLVVRTFFPKPCRWFHPVFSRLMHAKLIKNLISLLKVVQFWFSTVFAILRSEIVAVWV